MLHFTLLGGLGVALDGVPAKIAIPRRGVALLGYVLLQGPARLNRERVATILWPDESESNGRAKLRRMLYLIAQGAPAADSPAWLATDASSVMWNPAVSRTLDVEQIRDAVAATEPVHTSAIYRGDLLPELDDEWVLPERERLRDTHVGHLERVAKSYAAAKRFAEARAAILEVLRLEPWREDAMRTAIELRVAIGDRAGALVEFDRFRARLRDELGVDLMPETVALRATLVAEATARGAVAEPTRPAAPRSDTGAVFVGRERELALLAEQYARAEAGRGSLVLIGGESGVGKSGLIARHSRAVEERGGLVVRATTTFIETRPYQPFAAALQEALRHVDREALSVAGRCALERLLPGAAFASADEVFGDRETTLERNRLFEGVTSALDDVASRAPLLIVLEDVHWAGSDMMSLFEYVVRRTARSKILIVASYRDGDISRAHPLRAMRRRLQEESLVVSISLGPLRVREVERFLELSYGAASSAAAERLHAASGGLPLVLAELTAVGDLDGAIAAASPSRNVSGTLPALTSRLESLPPETRALLEIAAVVGLGFDVELIVEVSGWSEAETNRHLGVALGRRIVREATGGTYDFSHHLFRELVYEAIPPATKMRRHALVARALEELHPKAVDQLSSELAMHFERAGETERAIEALHTAASRALNVFAHEDARTFSTRALELGASGRAAIDALLVREEANRFADRRDAQREDLVRCEELIDRDADAALACRIFLRRFNLECQTANRDSGRDVLERLESAASNAGEIWKGWAALSRGRFELLKGRKAAALAALTEAAEAFEDAADSRGGFEAALRLAAWERNFGDVRAVEAHFARAERHLSSMQSADDLVIALYEERASVATHDRRYPEAKAWAERLLQEATKLRDIKLVASAHRLIGGSAARMLDMRPAYEHLAKALEIYEVLGEHIGAYSVMAFRGLLELDLGEVDAALASFDRARDIARTFEYDLGDAACAVNAAHVQNERGEFGAAVRLANSALELASASGNQTFRAAALVNLGVALRNLDRSRESSESLREACDLTDASGEHALGAEAWAEYALTCAIEGCYESANDAGDRAGALLSSLPKQNRPAIYKTLARAFEIVRDAAASSATGEASDDLRTFVS